MHSNTQLGLFQWTGEVLITWSDRNEEMGVKNLLDGLEMGLFIIILLSPQSERLFDMFQPLQPLLLREHGIWELELDFLKCILTKPWSVAGMGFRKDIYL